MVSEIIINPNLKLKKLTLKDVNENYLSWFDDPSLKKNLFNIKYKNLNELKKYYKKTIKNLKIFTKILQRPHGVF